MYWQTWFREIKLAVLAFAVPVLVSHAGDILTTNSPIPMVDRLILREDACPYLFCFWIGLVSYGLAIFFLASLGAVFWVIETCRACGGGQCCEWTGVGIVFFSGLGVSCGLIYSAFTFGYVRLQRAERRSERNLPAESGVEGRGLRLTGRLGMLIIPTLSGAISLQQATNLVDRGYLVRWQQMDDQIALAEGVLADGDQSNRMVERGLCLFEFWVRRLPGPVEQSAHLMSCSAAHRREVRYVQLQDGGYWKWEQRIPDIELILSRFGALLFGSIGGFLGGVFWIGRRLKAVAG